MIQPKPCGSLSDIDDNGHVIKKASHALIQTEWSPLVDGVVAIYRSTFGENLHSIWLRGSVAKGQAEKGAADLDSFAYLVEAAETPVEFEPAIEALKSRHPYCFHIEADANPVSDIEREMDGVMARIIKTQAVCLHGEDFSDKIPPFTLRDMIHYSRYLRFNLEEKLPAFLREDGGDPNEIQFTCTWTLRLLLRSLYETVMLEEGRWTNDLWPCYERFSARHPSREPQAMELLQLSLNPVADEGRLKSAVNAFTPWIYDEIREKLAIESDATY
ncbi:MAG: hypothetical protein ACR2RV_25715 [Verrucomicrobiales bacterium]